MAVKITDLIDPGEIEKLKQLDTELMKVLDTYTNVVKELAKGIEINVNSVGDIDKLEKLLVEKGKEAATVQKQLTQVVSEQGQVMANTTNTISRYLMQQERVNSAQRNAYTEHGKVKTLLEQLHGTYDGQLSRLVKIDAELKQNTQAQKENEKALKAGEMTVEDYGKAQMELVARSRQLRQEKSALNQILTAEEKANMNAETSYARMSQQLELLKKAYKGLSEDDRNSDYGKDLELTIQNLDAHLKDLAADQGEFQRNVGNYAIACQNGVASTEDLNRVLGLNASTVDGCIEQNKALERAKTQLDKSDKDYSKTLDRINTKIAENRGHIMDVTDVMDKMPRTVEEAEEQNKRLAAALKLVDVNADGAADTIKAYRDRIDQNNEMIQSVTGSNEQYADSLLSIVGINANFGQSFQALANSGGMSFIDGMNTKVKALGQTLFGLLANPWVLALLGITAVVSGVKWWYDYNKGLVEATKLTKDFTGLSGTELKEVRNEVQAVADTYDKDFREVLESANALSKQFGISIQDAMKLVEDGFVSGADVNGEFLDNIKEYPAYFREAGLSASEFIAITTQANKGGIYSDKGIDVIKEGNLRIREMTTATRDALEGIGISSEEVMRNLADGSMTTFDVMKQVSEKLAEFPASSSEVGTALADIFGGPGEDAGLQYILTLKDIDTNLDNVKNSAGELAKLQEEQLRSQVELENAIASVFDITGGSFETLTTQAKTFVNKGLIAIVNGIKDVVNWFIDLYNKSTIVMGVVQGMSLVFQTNFSIIASIIGYIGDKIVGLGNMIKGALTMDWETFSAGLNKFYTAEVTALTNVFNDVVNSTKEAWENMGKELKPLGLIAEVEVTETDTKTGNAGKTGYTPKLSDEEKAEQEKAAQEALKRQQELEDAKIALLADGHEKEIEQIRLNYQRRIDEITGNSETEKALRLALSEQMEKEVSDCKLRYQQNLAKVNLANRLAIVKKGSKEELDLRLAQIEANRTNELKEAEKIGADINLINQKFNQQRLNLEEEYAANAAQKIQERYAREQSERDNAYISEINALKTKYAEDLALAKGNHAEQTALKEKYDADEAAITEKYAQQSAEASIAMFEDILNTENLSAEDRLKYEQELAQAKVDLETKMADASITEINRITDADDKAKEKRLANAKQWLQVASNSLNGINELVSSIYDAKISKIEEEQDANTKAGEAEQERIAELVEQNVITEEEGEARKRAAEAATAQKNEELEKKKQQLQHKQAVWNKANNIAQCTIQTALAIMNAMASAPWPLNIAMAAVAGAMGAVQLATIIATPIPAYAKGTDYHKGGLAVVGDGGEPELVVYGDKSWITPDTPTLVDLPSGAMVIPDINNADCDMVELKPTLLQTDGNAPVIVNDYKRLEDKMDTFIVVMKHHSNRQHSVATNMAMYHYINFKI